MDQEELEQLEKGALHINCLRMELIGQGDGEQRTYAGPGYIRQVIGKGFEVTIFTEGKPSATGFVGSHHTEPGTLVSKSGHFSLTAHDVLYGRKWSVERILRSELGGWRGADGYVASAEVAELSCVEDDNGSQGKPRLEMIAFGKAEFPTTAETVTRTSIGGEERFQTFQRNVAQVQCCGLEIEMRQDGPCLRLDATTQDEAGILPPKIDDRLTESLHFVLGVRIPWSYVRRIENGKQQTRVRSGSNRPWHQSRPPLRFALIDETGCVWSAFERYLAFVLKDDAAYQHPLSTQVWAVVKSAEATVEVQAMVLTVAVESVLDRFFSDTVAVPATTVAAVDNLLQYVRQWDGDANVKNRALSPIGHIKSVRAQDCLRQLADVGLLTEEYIDAWKKLRNTAAHGDWKMVEDLQGMVDHIAKVRVLFYQIVLARIGYCGKQTDYGRHGWPMIDYPLQPAAGPKGSTP